MNNAECAENAEFGMRSAELKPIRCGCGGEAKVISYLSREYCKMAYYVRCVECGTETDDLLSETEAIQAWNKAMGAKDINVPRKERTAKVTYRSTTMGLSFCCGNCGKPVHSEGKYCHHCGARLEWE